MANNIVAIFNEQNVSKEQLLGFRKKQSDENFRIILFIYFKFKAMLSLPGYYLHKIIRLDYNKCINIVVMVWLNSQYSFKSTLDVIVVGNY